MLLILYERIYPYIAVRTESVGEKNFSDRAAGRAHTFWHDEVLTRFVTKIHPANLPNHQTPFG